MTDMEPVFSDAQPVQVLSTPGFSSNDPATEGLRMVPIDDNPPAEDFEESDVEDPDEDLGDPEADPTIRVPDAPAEGDEQEDDGDDSNKKAGEWVAEIKAAQDQDALDAVLARYEATGKDFTTVAEAAEARQDALDSDDS